MSENNDAGNKSMSEAATRAVQKKLPQGSWLCVCGRVNTEVTGTCVCGIKKKDARAVVIEKKRKDAELHQQVLNKKRKEIREKQFQTADPDIIDILREYRELLDSGVLTKEEFEKKKNEWLELTR